MTDNDFGARKDSQDVAAMEISKEYHGLYTCPAWPYFSIDGIGRTISISKSHDSSLDSEVSEVINGNQCHSRWEATSIYPFT